EGKKKAKEKIARHQTELQSVREDELSHEDEVDDGASEHDQDDASIPDVGGSTQKSKGKKVQRGMKVRRRNGAQAEGVSQNSKRTSTIDRNFALYTEQKLRLQRSETSERMRILRMEADSRERMMGTIERSSITNSLLLENMMETQAMILELLKREKGSAKDKQ
ncbi:hypothetical protein BGX27_000543, partial [Mortierella sp. AM989]